MTDVTVITPPDNLLNDVFKILLIYPSVEIRKSISNILMNSTKTINLYLYDEDTVVNPEWLLQHTKICNLTIIDVDNCNPIIKNLASFIISNPNTFYLTNDELTPYNMLSANRVYDLYWIESYLKEE
jgi:hypothetical protein|tara:strand:- start:664 stop:1044 length:381 start_codon:yes stop_codon:yes gene_type:complete